MSFHLDATRPATLPLCGQIQTHFHKTGMGENGDLPLFSVRKESQSQRRDGWLRMYPWRLGAGLSTVLTVVTLARAHTHGPRCPDNSTAAPVPRPPAVGQIRTQMINIQIHIHPQDSKGCAFPNSTRWQEVNAHPSSGSQHPTPCHGKKGSETVDRGVPGIISPQKLCTSPVKTTTFQQNPYSEA